MGEAKVLIIEDDRSLAEVVSYNLTQAGYEVYLAHDGQDGINQAQLRQPDVVVLDLMLPVIDGLDVCRRLRSDPATRTTRIVMLTAKAEQSDQLVGFSLGADDYVTKPLSVEVLMQRIKILCRRESDEAGQQQIASQGVIIDTLRHRVTVDEKSLHLTRSEFRLLGTLIRQPGRVFSRAELIDAALGEDTLAMERTIDVHIRALRKKLTSHADLIETVRGVGYRFRDPAATHSYS